PQPAIDLEEQPFAHGDDRVAALCAWGGHWKLLVVGPRNLRECARRPEPQRSARRLELHAGSDGSDQCAAERVVAEGVREHADLSLLPHFRNGERREGAHALLVAVFPGKRERQEVCLRFALVTLGPGEPDQEALLAAPQFGVID